MNRIKILLVDDEEDLVFTLAERLQFRGYDAEPAINCTDAIKKTENKIFDAAIIDVKLRGINGIELMKMIKELQPTIKVILITGHGTEEEGRKGISHGASDYLIKPINIDILIEKIKKALNITNNHC
jgi:DNA-binding NtrC family response regulator